MLSATEKCEVSHETISGAQGQRVKNRTVSECPIAGNRSFQSTLAVTPINPLEGLCQNKLPRSRLSDKWQEARLSLLKSQLVSEVLNENRFPRRTLPSKIHVFSPRSL